MRLSVYIFTDYFSHTHNLTLPCIESQLTLRYIFTIIFFPLLFYLSPATCFPHVFLEIIRLPTTSDGYRINCVMIYTIYINSNNIAVAIEMSVLLFERPFFKLTVNTTAVITIPQTPAPIIGYMIIPFLIADIVPFAPIMI